MNRRPSINDIARETGVSAATVSLGLRDKGRMSDETRSRIKAMAEKLGYVPNANARSLVGGKTQLISISMPGIGSFPGAVGSVQYYFRLLGAAAAKALELDYGLLITSSSDKLDRVAVDGTVVVDPSLDDPTVATFDRLGLPVVTIGRRIGAAGSSVRELVVDNDYSATTGDMLDHLLEQGSERIALLATDPIDSFQQDTIDAYTEWCGRHHIPSRIVMSDSPDPRDAAKVVGKIIDGANRPDAVYATIDTLAEALLERAGSEGLTVPGDICISTMSDSQIAQATKPALTTIDEKPVELGDAAVEMLISAIVDPEFSPSTVLVDTELIPRGSTVRNAS